MATLVNMAYRAFTARRLANITGSDEDDYFATKLENELLSKRKELGMVEEPFPVPETQVGNGAYAAWAALMEDRF